MTAAVDRRRRVWTIGILRDASFLPLAGTPTFHAEGHAAAWVSRQLAANRIRLAQDRDLLTWRLEQP